MSKDSLTVIIKGKKVFLFTFLLSFQHPRLRKTSKKKIITLLFHLTLFFPSTETPG